MDYDLPVSYSLEVPASEDVAAYREATGPSLDGRYSPVVLGGHLALHADMEAIAADHGMTVMALRRAAKTDANVIRWRDYFSRALDERGPVSVRAEISLYQTMAVLQGIIASAHLPGTSLKTVLDAIKVLQGQVALVPQRKGSPGETGFDGGVSTLSDAALKALIDKLPEQRRPVIDVTQFTDV